MDVPKELAAAKALQSISMTVQHSEAQALGSTATERERKSSSEA